MLTQDRLKHLLDLDEATGVFRWKRPTSRAVKSGQRAGRVANNGYVGIMVDGVRHQAHRLVWLWYEGALPEKEIDHINGERADNRRDNLRLATRGENQQNIGSARKHSASGLLGVNAHRRKWRAQIRHAGTKYYLGLFDTPDEAHRAYLRAKAALHTFQPTLRTNASAPNEEKRK